MDTEHKDESATAPPVSVRDTKPNGTTRIKAVLAACVTIVLLPLMGILLALLSLVAAVMVLVENGDFEYTLFLQLLIFIVLCFGWFTRKKEHPIKNAFAALAAVLLTVALTSGLITLALNSSNVGDEIVAGVIGGIVMVAIYVFVVKTAFTKTKKQESGGEAQQNVSSEKRAFFLKGCIISTVATAGIALMAPLRAGGMGVGVFEKCYGPSTCEPGKACIAAIVRTSCYSPEVLSWAIFAVGLGFTAFFMIKLLPQTTTTALVGAAGFAAAVFVIVQRVFLMPTFLLSATLLVFGCVVAATALISKNKSLAFWSGLLVVAVGTMWFIA